MLETAVKGLLNVASIYPILLYLHGIYLRTEKCDSKPINHSGVKHAMRLVEKEFSGFL